MLSPKQAAQPNPSYPALYRSGHHISMEHRLRRKHLNSDTNASEKKYLKEIQQKSKEETFFFRKNEKIKRKKKDKKREKKKSRKKKEKRAQRGVTTRDWPKKMIFHIRTVKRNRNEIEAQKNQILSTQQRQRK